VLSIHGFKQRGFFFVPHLLRHGTSVYTASHEGPAPTTHIGVRTGDARITRSLRLCSNHCATRAASLSAEHRSKFCSPSQAIDGDVSIIREKFLSGIVSVSESALHGHVCSLIVLKHLSFNTNILLKRNVSQIHEEL
jgi:hypothetical protein